MTSALTLSLAMGMLGAGEPPRLVLPRIPLTPSHDEDAELRAMLGRCRQVQKLTEWTIKMVEGLIKQGPNRPDANLELKREVEDCRAFLDRLKREERVLLWWQEERKRNPGRETDIEGANRLLKVLELSLPVRPGTPLLKPGDLKP